MNSRRNYGIDLLRSAAMLMIVILHVLGVGGVLGAATQGSAAYNAAWGLETLCMCSVNCFGLVSGYVLSRGRHRYSRIVTLWLRVVLECLAVCAAFSIIAPGSVAAQDWIKAATPIYHNVYWYFTAYFALFFFVPYINKMMAALSKRDMLVLSGSIIILFCFLNNVTHEEIFATNAGYSFLWLCCLYILGAAIRGLDIKDNFSIWWLLAGVAVSVLLACVLMLKLQIQRIIGYTSPLILAAAIALLLMFRRISVTSPKLVKFISMLTRTSFGVYIIHTNPLIWTRVLSNRFVGFTQQPTAIMVLLILAAALSIYALSTLGDWLTEKLLKLVHIERLEKAIDKFCGKITGTRQKAQNTSEN